MSGPKRYPKPGSIVTAWWEDDRYRHHCTGVAVMATSRHLLGLDAGEALALLVQEHGPETTIDRVGVWHSITKRDMENRDMPEEADEAGWCEDASGLAWVQVAYPTIKEAADVQ